VKKMISIIRYIITLSVLGQGYSASAESVFHNLNLKNCHKTKCLSLTTLKAESSQFLPLYSFGEFTLKISDNGKERTVAGFSGYFDFSQELIVVETKNNTELLIDLKNLTERNFSK
jgi:hypothetical protein